MSGRRHVRLMIALAATAALVVTLFPSPAGAAEGDAVVGYEPQQNDPGLFAHDWFAVGNERPRVGDVNGDGCDDIVTFVRGLAGDVYTALSDCDGTFGPGRFAHGWFSILDEIPRVADIDNDGCADLITFVRGLAGDVYTALSNCDGTFGPGRFAHDWFAILDEKPEVGDVTGDGCNDLITFVRSSGAVYVAPSLCDGRFAGGQLWRTEFAEGSDVPRMGDFDGDGRADIARFTRGNTGDVFIELSDGTEFVDAKQYKAHDWFAVGNETPMVGDVNGDGLDDIVTFVRGLVGDVWIALSNGARFGVSRRTHDWFSVAKEVPAVGNFYDAGPGAPAGPQGATDDLVTFVRAASGDVYTSRSNAQPFQPSPPEIEVTELVTGHPKIWDVDISPDGNVFFTERDTGILGRRAPDGAVTDVGVVPGVHFTIQTGLMSFVLDPDFGVDGNRRFYVCKMTEPRHMAVAVYELNATYDSIATVDDPLLRWHAGDELTLHAGCRLEFDAAGNLLVGTGDGYIRTSPQDPTLLNGKVLRIDRFTGQGVPQNPFAGSANANTRRVFTIGHRNVQGIALQPGTNRIFSAEHGPAYDDEINHLVPGGNYGWHPVDPFGDGYDELHQPMTNLELFPNAIPAVWRSGRPTVAHSGITFLEGAQWGDWDGALVAANLKTEHLKLLFLDGSGTRVRAHTEILASEHGRLRSVAQGPDGALYVTTDSAPNAKVLRIEAVG